MGPWPTVGKAYTCTSRWSIFCLLGSGYLVSRQRCCSMGLALPRAEGGRVSWPQLAGLASGVGLLARSTHQWESRQN